VKVHNEPGIFRQYDTFTDVQKTVLHYHIGTILEGHGQKTADHDEVYGTLTDEQKQTFDILVDGAKKQYERTSNVKTR
jgi:hypothetical protein